MKITASSELKHICKILKSCENQLHIITVEQMFKNFINKWKNHIDSNEMKEFIDIFEVELDEKINKL